MVLLPYEITLFSNKDYAYIKHDKFYYLMKLHYSQTKGSGENDNNSFYYLMKLHYSQTIEISFSTSLAFYYLMKLHYSQTIFSCQGALHRVLLPYDITLFSNQLSV